jgi:N-acetyl-gamma-glutamyl-phosphate reductase
MIRAAIVGGAGYVGGELIRLLLHHPNVQISEIQSSSQQGKLIHSAHADLKGWTDLKFVASIQQDFDVLFLCGGHGKSKSYLENNQVSSDKVIIDLSTDYRLKNANHDFVYGLCELNHSKIKGSKHIANCGCFATAIQLPLLPFAAHSALLHEIHVTAITGATGAGQEPSSTTHFSWRDNNISIYKAFAHQHLGEITESIKQLQPSFNKRINFIPMRGDFTRGIFASVYFECDWALERAKKVVNDYYKTSPFVHLSDSPISLKEVVNTNNAFLYVDKFENLIRIESVIDNLLKGAVGQAVQNMNLVFGIPEETGLKLKASAF